jgi:hypothetical protein
MPPWEFMLSLDRLFRFDCKMSATLVGQLFQYISGKHPAAGELRAFSHQLQEFILSFAPDHGRIAQIDDKFAPIKMLIRIPPRSAQFAYPWLNEFSLYEQPAL